MAVLALAGCGSAADSDAIPGASGTQSAADLKCGLGNGNKATGAPIKVAAIATESGGVDFSSSPKSAKAYFDCVNDNGGINGRPIQYAIGDDALDPTKTAQLAAGYAADTSVVAMVGDATFVGCQQANSEYKKANLYSITGVGVPQACFQSSNIAPVNAGPRTSALATLQYFERKGEASKFFAAGLKTVGNGDWVSAGINAYAAEKGIELVGNVLSDPAESNWLPLISQIASSKATSLVIADPAPIAASILQAAEQQDAKGEIRWACTASCYDAQFGQQIGSYWNGFIANSELQLVNAADGKDLNQWRAVMAKYAAKGAPRDTFSQAGYLAGKIFVDTLLKISDPSTINRETVSKALVGITGYASDLLCAPWYYGEADEHHANHATRMAQVKDGKWVSLEDCQDVDDPETDNIKAAEQSQGLLKPSA
ncbi:ABC transporter substrate-binding protein [Micromonospora sp. KC606]|uniref:ABC transporter substrate-binding protein n=1 Tax=Micromonospora sp. KC606 TaxID=2530379 RepID=UPI001404A469|nr:ABC transporter substrate-binding protein [Micromonospora sp. KC606]